MLDEIINIVKGASKIMKKHDFVVRSKDSVVNLVTSADIEVQQFLTNELTKLVPDSGIYGEESDKYDLNHEYVWIIDPIDGTTNFIRGINQCCISVALKHNEDIIIGVVYDPFTEDLYYAEKGKGAFNNGHQIHVSNKSFEESLFCTAMSLYRKEYAPICFDIIKDTYEQCNDMRRFGTCALELCYLASGKCDIYFEMRVYPWDYCGAYLILKEAGGILTSIKGNLLKHDKATPLIGANNAVNHAKLVSIVDKYLKEIPYDK